MVCFTPFVQLSFSPQPGVVVVERQYYTDALRFRAQAHEIGVIQRVRAGRVKFWIKFNSLFIV